MNPPRPLPSKSTPREPASAGPGCVLTIGSFDGVHLGHQALIRRARDLADGFPPSTSPAARVIALAFDPCPMSVIRPESAPPRLSTFDQRRDWLLAAGADEVIRLEPTRDLLSLSAAEFVARQVARHHPLAWVEGPDFRFGRDRAGDVATLAALAVQHGFDAAVVDPVTVPLTDHSIVHARSTMARWLITQGRVRDAACILGRPHQLIGQVVPGDRRGRTIGFPTANLDGRSLAPADGVYAGLAHLPDGRSFPAAVSIGTKPTFGDRPRAVEAFLLAPNAASNSWAPLPGLPEYGWRLRLDLLDWVRDQITYPSLPPLLEQMERDCERVAAIAAAGHHTNRPLQEAPA